MKEMRLAQSQEQRVVTTLTWMASKPQYSLASSSRGTSACSKRVVPHVFKMKRLLETNMLLSLWRTRTRVKDTCLPCGLPEHAASHHTLLSLTEASYRPRKAKNATVMAESRQVGVVTQQALRVFGYGSPAWLDTPKLVKDTGGLT